MQISAVPHSPTRASQYDLSDDWASREEKNRRTAEMALALGAESA